MAFILRSLPLFQRARRIALYLPNDGEADTLPIAVVARAAGKRLYLPVLDGGQERRLRFVEWREGEHFVKNRFGILEPRRRRGGWLAKSRLDLVIVPLVAVDRNGTRLGMGGGYYDRTFTGCKHRRAWRRPRLIGLAHDFQVVDRIEGSEWDVPLDAVVTESGVICFGYEKTGGNAES